MNLAETQVGAVVGLGFDAGGTRTRWALASGGGDRHGKIVAEGAVAGFSAGQMDQADGRSAIDAALAELASQVLQHARPTRVHAGLTGFGGASELLRGRVAKALGVAESAVTLGNDIEIAYRDVFAPGEGYLVYAGTGSIAALIDADGVLHRAGGRGYLLDDGGGGVWIAKEALRHIWRAEDEWPGSWRASTMACEIFARLGGSDWAVSRQFLYAGERGEIGQLALAVAQTADADPVARAILQNAGQELARLGQALLNRFGARPLALCGRVSQLHPLIEASFRAALPEDASITVRVSQAHHAAAGIALRSARTAAKDALDPD